MSRVKGCVNNAGDSSGVLVTGVAIEASCGQLKAPSPLELSDRALFTSIASSHDGKLSLCNAGRRVVWHGRG